jgi:hypothetical protein
MNEFFLGERGVDLIVALVALEALSILSWRAVFKRGPSPLPLISNLLAGAFLLLALRNALAAASGGWVAVCLLGALVAHLADLRLRWEDIAPNTQADRPRSNIKATLSFFVPKSSARQSFRSRSDKSSSG